MATLPELIADRAAAGAAYAAAAEAYVAAWIELSAHESAVGNANVGGPKSDPPFGNLPEILRHGEFMPLDRLRALTSPNAVIPAREARANAIIRSFNGVPRP